MLLGLDGLDGTFVKAPANALTGLFQQYKQDLHDLSHTKGKTLKGQFKQAW